MSKNILKIREFVDLEEVPSQKIRYLGTTKNMIVSLLQSYMSSKNANTAYFIES